MLYSSIAIIGTAGRKEDQQFLTKGHYERMVLGAAKVIGSLGANIQDDYKVVSGGAAWADHVAVSLVTSGFIKPQQLTLYLPSTLSSKGFVGNDPKSDKTASTAMYYHKLFSDKLGFNTFNEILEVEKQGANIIEGNGNFFARNELVAKSVTPDGVLLAYTFGDSSFDQDEWSARKYPGSTSAQEAGLKDGGTAHTWTRAKPSLKFHCKLGKDPWS